MTGHTTRPSGRQLLDLVSARRDLRDAVLHALMAPDTESNITAWNHVDTAAGEVVRRRRAYDRHVRALLAGAGRAEPSRSAPQSITLTTASEARRDAGGEGAHS